MKQYLQKLIQAVIVQLQTEGLLDPSLTYQINIERTKDAKFGDYSSNIALILAKAAKMPPRDLAQKIVANLATSDKIKKIEIAGPGFINFFIAATVQHNIISDILEAGENFGKAEFGQGKRVHIEFVSANPTGPLHVGHGRGAAYGAATADLLAAVGYEVHREYYVNDAGRQMNILAISVWLRYLELCGETVQFPSNGYKGEYIIEIAKALQQEYGVKFKQSFAEIIKDITPDESPANGGGDKEAHVDDIIVKAKALLKDNYETVHQFSMTQILNDIRDDLEEFGVHYQEWFSENTLAQSGAIAEAIEVLRKAGHVYEEDGALWFRSSLFGDEKDRVLVRENGQSTYFASDIAYHWNKLKRGFQIVIDVLGADHHGYVPRVNAAMQALGVKPETFHVPLVQFAILYRGGERVQMSTRSGSFVTLRQLREEVGNDAARFFYIMRKSEQHMDFDLDLAKSKSNENPVYYIQYAHARICSVFRQLAEKGIFFDQELGLTSLDQLTTTHEKELLNSLAHYPEIIAIAANKLEPHQVANYLRELAHIFHAYYNAEQFIVPNENLRNARLCLITAARQVMVNGLELLGVSAPEKM